MPKPNFIIPALCTILLVVLAAACSAGPLIPNSVQKDLVKGFKVLTRNVTLLVFSDGEKPCEHCTQVEQLTKELSELSAHIKVERYSLAKNPLVAKHYGITAAPAIILTGKQSYGIRFLGLPGGYEFSNLIAAIHDVSRGSSTLSTATITKLRSITKPVHIEVLVTPTCPYCAPMVRLAHQFALHTSLIQADMVEANEFPELVSKYQISGVPVTVINGSIAFSGRVAEEQFLQAVLKAGK